MSTFVYVQGAQRGPYTDEEVARLLETKEFSLDDLAWKEGFADWVPLRTCFQPAAPPPVPEMLKPKQVKRLENIYRTSRQMALVCVLGIFIPLALILGAPLGIVNFLWRKSLLREIDEINPVLPKQQAKEVAYLREHRQELLFPLYTLLAYVIILGGLATVVIARGVPVTRP